MIIGAFVIGFLCGALVATWAFESVIRFAFRRIRR
jgi:hypothetical protein